jgi:uncharacterized radical SAM superfamily Fe-S cluster-containing enzyme
MCLVGVRMLFRHLDASFPKVRTCAQMDSLWVVLNHWAVPQLTAYTVTPAGLPRVVLVPLILVAASTCYVPSVLTSLSAWSTPSIQSPSSL